MPNRLLLDTIHRPEETRMKLYKEPLLHFLLLGAVIFAIHTWRQQNTAGAEATGAERIEVTAATINRLKDGWTRQFQRTPDEDDLRGLVTAHIREEVLFREALALGLDRDDTIVRRRLAQKMEFLTEDIAAVADPDEAALTTFYAENAARYAQAARVSFRHVYFSREKRGTVVDADARAGLAALEMGASHESLGDGFLHGFEFAERDEAEVATLFGPDFMKQLARLPMRTWHGPVASSYGVHLVWIEALGEAKPMAFDTMRETVLRDLIDERRRAANAEIVEKLRERYQVSVDETALVEAASSVSKTAQR